MDLPFFAASFQGGSTRFVADESLLLTQPLPRVHGFSSMICADSFSPLSHLVIKSFISFLFFGSFPFSFFCLCHDHLIGKKSHFIDSSDQHRRPPTMVVTLQLAIGAFTSSTPIVIFYFWEEKRSHPTLTMLHLMHSWSLSPILFRSLVVCPCWQKRKL